jgi:hypothetical protein
VSGRSIPLDVRDRLRAHQEAEAQAVTATTVATARREAAILRRDEVVAAQDELVRMAVSQEEATMVDLAATSGVERAAALLDMPIPMLRKLVRGRRTSDDLAPRSQNRANTGRIETRAPTSP